MNLEYFETNLNKLGLDYKLHSGASELEIQDAQIRLEVSFPSKVYSFYKNINGLIVNEPKLEVYGLNNVKRRAKLINAEINIKNDEVGTVAELEIAV